jgi:TolB protein
MPVEGGEPQQLTTDPADDFLPAWSPDGKEIAFYSFRPGNRDLYVMSATGGSLRQLTNHPAQDRYPDWSPDGKHLVFYSDRTGSQELHVISKEKGELEGETPRQLTFKGGGFPKWSPDGRLIAFNRSGEGLFVISPEGDDERLLAGGRGWYSVWSPDGRMIYRRARDQDANVSFWSVPVSGGDPKLLFQADDPTRTSSRPEFATDGERLFFTLTEYESDVWMMELSPDSWQ